MESAQIHQLQQRAEAASATDPNSLDTYLRLARVKQITDSSKSTVMRWIASGKFPAPIYRDGNTVLWSLRQIQQWQAQKLEQQRSSKA